MATFSYRGRDQQGKQVNGRLEAGSAQAAAEKLLAKAITPVDITLQQTESKIISKRLNIHFMPAVGIVKSEVRQSHSIFLRMFFENIQPVTRHYGAPWGAY
ncbi:MAG: hypothetical protein GY821_10045 [Gammaproteobacteria bacterium]|nr:hypothetical protein [Gammaproteobacteria bacterium]